MSSWPTAARRTGHFALIMAAGVLMFTACASSGESVQPAQPDVTVPATEPTTAAESSSPTSTDSATSMPATPEPMEPTVSPSPDSPSPVPPTVPPTAVPPTTVTPTPVTLTPVQATAEPESTCVTLADFSSESANAQWVVVNDNVMGGRSLGDRSFDGDTMTFRGSINTNGGGFASLRLPLEPGVLEVADRVIVRARSDSRQYLLTFSDGLEGRSSRISFRAPLEFSTPGRWETVTVRLADLYAASFGQPVDTDPFRPDLTTQLGIMLSDGLDGEFALEIDSIEACSPPG